MGQREGEAASFAVNIVISVNLMAKPVDKAR